MADLGFNGSTLTFNGGAQSEVISASYSVGGADVDVTTLSSAAKEYVAGMDDAAASFEIKGGTALARGDAGALSIAFNDGTTCTINSVYVSSVETTGSMDGEITTSIAFKPKAT